ncbi:MAG: hypothetical protein WEB60_01340 [Terrimicrobiaceae bacterium]
MKTLDHPILENLPGSDLISKGLHDLSEGLTTIESCLVEIARPRLERCGLIHKAPPSFDREITLYHLLAQQPGASHARFNALLRELVSFEHALDLRLSKRTKGE